MSNSKGKPLAEVLDFESPDADDSYLHKMLDDWQRLEKKKKYNMVANIEKMIEIVDKFIQDNNLPYKHDRYFESAPSIFANWSNEFLDFIFICEDLEIVYFKLRSIEINNELIVQFPLPNSLEDFVNIYFPVIKDNILMK